MVCTVWLSDRLRVVLDVPGDLPRSCVNCDVDLPTVWYDILCMPCAEAEGSDYMADVQARKERAAHLRACEDCGLPTYADGGPLCPICRFGREGFAVVVGGTGPN